MGMAVSMTLSIGASLGISVAAPAPTTIFSTTDFRKDKAVAVFSSEPWLYSTATGGQTEQN